MLWKILPLRKILMAAAVLVLLLLVLVTPLLAGREDISAFPKLVLTASGDDLLMFVTSWSGGTTVYRDIALGVTPGEGGPPVIAEARNLTWGLEAVLNLSDHPRAWINVTVHDQRRATYEFRGLLEATRDPRAGWTFLLASNADANPFRFTAREIAWPNQPFSVVFPRREAP